MTHSIKKSDEESSLEKLKRLILDMKKDVVRGFVVVGGGFGPDKMVTKEETEALYKKVKKALDEYEKEGSVGKLAQLHDAIQRMLVKNVMVPNEVIEHIISLFHDTNEYKRLEEQLKKIDFSNLEIDEEDALHLASLSLGVEDKEFIKSLEGFGVPGFFLFNKPNEYGGGIRIEGKRIKLITTNTLSHESFTPVSLKTLVKGDAHGWWHTHPYYTGVERPSLSDNRVVKLYKIPLVTAILGRDGKPKIFITDPSGKVHKVKVRKLPR